MTALDCLMDFASDTMRCLDWPGILTREEYDKACLYLSFHKTGEWKDTVLMHNFKHNPDRRRIAQLALRHLKMEML